MSVITELKTERQYVLKEINETLSQIVNELKELNELAAEGAVFNKDLEEANAYIAALKHKFVPQEVANASQSKQNATKSKEKKNSSIQIIEQPMESTLMQTIQDLSD